MVLIVKMVLIVLMVLIIVDSIDRMNGAESIDVDTVNSLFKFASQVIGSKASSISLILGVRDDL